MTSSLWWLCLALLCCTLAKGENDAKSTDKAGVIEQVDESLNQLDEEAQVEFAADVVEEDIPDEEENATPKGEAEDIKAIQEDYVVGETKERGVPEEEVIVSAEAVPKADAPAPVLVEVADPEPAGTKGVLESAKVSPEEEQIEVKADSEDEEISEEEEETEDIAEYLLSQEDEKVEGEKQQETYKQKLIQLESRYDQQNAILNDWFEDSNGILKQEYQVGKIEKRSSYHRTTICEGHSKRIACSGNRVIHLVNANYGRTDKGTCKHWFNLWPNTNCRSSTSERKVKWACDRKTSCNLQATNSVFGDPCFGTVKYLAVTYQCISPVVPFRHLTLCQHSRGSIKCPRNHCIRVHRANYGRLSRYTCRKFNLINSRNCRSHSSERTVKNKCDNRNSCALEASDSVFGDPCYGTWKYLKVVYQCIPQRINGNWGSWGSYNRCSKSCDVGTQTRTRTCTNPPPANGGATCTGSNRQSQNCEVRKCPVNGLWSEWSSYSACSVTCGVGMTKRSRTCTNPPPANGGEECEGESEDEKECKLTDCPVNGLWSEWSSYSACSVTCGVGMTKRSRTCTNPAPANGGEECEGESEEMDECQLEDCPVNGLWSEWSSYSACSVTCGVGMTKRSRTCTNPPPANGGEECEGESEESNYCILKSCPVNGSWSEWSSYSACSATCGVGTMVRNRTCTNPAPSDGGEDCEGDKGEMEYCPLKECSTDILAGTPIDEAFATGQAIIKVDRTSSPHKVTVIWNNGRPNGHGEIDENGNGVQPGTVTFPDRTKTYKFWYHPDTAIIYWDVDNGSHVWNWGKKRVDTETEPNYVQVPNIKNCWTKCGQKGGKCDVCGPNGWCCRKGNMDCPAHIADAGLDTGHSCVVPDCWKHISPGCVAAHNIIRYQKKTVQECKTLCNENPECQSVEYGVPHGGEKNMFEAGDCQLNNNNNPKYISFCNGTENNLDLYVKEECNEEPEVCWTHKPKSCVLRHNILGGRHKNSTVAECKELCENHADCVAFEYGVNYNGGYKYYHIDECILNNSADDKKCDGEKSNLDLYVKKPCDTK